MMGAYHQLGHHSESMVLESELEAFRGVILSPVNYGPGETLEQCVRFRQDKPSLDLIFDPQLYVPSSGRGCLPQWRHMPGGLDTADASSVDWWRGALEEVLVSCSAFAPNAVCSPATFPHRGFVNAHYTLWVEVANALEELTRGEIVRPLATALVGLQDLGREHRHLEVASILTKYRGRGIYLVLWDETLPRRERSDSASLEAALRLIKLLADAGYDVTVAFTSTEMILWKAVGAQNVATGKFFNLRRFTSGRFEPDTEGGGRNLPYWLEPSLLAFLREADLRRFRRDFPLSSRHESNPFSQKILQGIDQADQRAWLADSWRQYLRWFATTEADYEGTSAEGKLFNTAEMINTANEAWRGVRNAHLRFEEEANDGSWVRAWDIALGELSRKP